MRADQVFTSYSANFEDVILHRIFGGRASGTYLDVGASDPVRGNDTKALYDQGWSGVNLVDPALVDQFQRARPRDRTLAVSAAPDPVPDGGAADLVRLGNGGRDVLSDEDWDRLLPNVVVAVAADRRTGQRSEGLGSALEHRGYAPAYFDGLNVFHVKHSFQGADGAFNLPPNLFDRFVPHRSEGAAVERLTLDNADLRHEAERLRASVAALTADMLALNQDLETGLAERAELHALRPVAAECVRLRLRVEELDAYARHVEAELGLSRAQSSRTASELEHIRGLYEFMTVQHSHVSTLHGQVLAQHETAEAERQRLAMLYEQERALREALQSSTSWRVTRPLRAVMGRVRRG